MFKDKALIENNLIPFGFKLQNDYYIYEIDICDSQFRMIVEINKNSDIRTEIIDKFTNEPYILHLIESSSGTFVYLSDIYRINIKTNLNFYGKNFLQMQSGEERIIKNGTGYYSFCQNEN